MSFIAIILLLIYLRGPSSFSGGLGFRSPVKSNWSLNEFLEQCDKGTSMRKIILSEKNVVSLTYRFRGRFDSIIVRCGSGPVLEEVIERKFPRSVLPKKPIEEDMFQASLYVLGLKEKGFSIRSTMITTVYCLQTVADDCLHNNEHSSCWRCNAGVRFSQRFNEPRTVKSIKKLDEIWYREREARPKPSPRKCRLCPFSKQGVCNHSAV